MYSPRVGRSEDEGGLWRKNKGGRARRKIV